MLYEARISMRSTWPDQVHVNPLGQHVLDP